jgi:hypothetical protein
MILAMLAAMVISVSTGLSDLRWQSRVLLVFADSDASASRQLSLIAERGEEIADRDLVVFTVTGDAVRLAAGSTRVEPDADELRRAYGIDPAAPLTVVLVGKDGGEKLRRDGPVAGAELFGVIDAMPMRRQEMRGD